MKILVVPSIREGSIVNFLNHWQPNQRFDKTIVVEDNPEKTFELASSIIHYTWKDVEKDLGENSWIISRRSSAIRSYGFLKAYQMGADYIYTLDDDCLPLENRFVDDHISVLNNSPIWSPAIHGLRTRGLPYKNFGKLENVMLNVGLWTGVPDFDAPSQLLNPRTDFQPPAGNRILPSGQLFPICGMNMCFKREFTPLSYFAPMGFGQEFNRFDDIWFAVISLKICDKLRWKIGMGEPFVYHSRESNVFKNLIQEGLGIEFNESFWEIISDFDGEDPISCLNSIANNFLNYNKTYKDYINRYGKALKIWSNLFC